MNLDRIKEYYNITFIMGVFFVVMVENFYKAVGSENHSITILQWGLLAVIYIIAYINYDIRRDIVQKRPHIKKNILSILQTNLILIAILFIIMGSIEKIDSLNNYLEFFLMITFKILLIVIGLLIPLALIFLPSLAKK